MPLSLAMSDLSRLLEAIFRGADGDYIKVEMSEWREALAIVAQYLERPMPLPQVEHVEVVLKRYLSDLMRSPIAGTDARFLAEWSRDVGFILKYKPYGIKCTTPFGYSVFLQNAGEGFSFQRHLTRKTETFHILQPLAGARVFLCSSEDWASTYEATAFDAWLDGENHEEYDRLSLRPQAGDVYHVRELRTVHSILGCVLEEFATVSTDMVDRLHDQNRSTKLDVVADRNDVARRLQSLPAHRPRVSRPSDGGRALELEPQPCGDGEVVTLSSTGTIVAERYEVETDGIIQFEMDRERARVIFVVRGCCEVELRGVDDAAEPSVPRLRLCAGNVMFVAPGVSAWLYASEMVAVSSHRIYPEAALA